MVFKHSYSSLDQFLHRLAFNTLSSQMGLVEFESFLNRKFLNTIDIQKPVFVTALPRAGTTSLLELLVNSGEFVSHAYSDMPFLMLPIVWQKLSKLLKQNERTITTLGGGLMLSEESPESFEEIIWRHFWPKHYGESRIIPWEKNQSTRFEKYFRDHLQKIVFLRVGERYDGQRYVSNNNLNLARIPYLTRMFTECSVIVPFLDPYQHAALLSKQHQHFSNIHRQDEFAKKYMRDIGRYDFGENLKPIDFNRWLEKSRFQDPFNIHFWLEYWLNSYRYLLAMDFPQVTLMSYEALCIQAERGLRMLADAADMAEPEKLVRQNGRLSLANPYPLNISVDEELRVQVDEVYQQLLARSPLR